MAMAMFRPLVYGIRWMQKRKKAKKETLLNSCRLELTIVIGAA
jgi:hypothetical protein